MEVENLRNPRFLDFVESGNWVRCKPVGPRRGEGADGSRSLCAPSTHAGNPAMGPKRIENWVRICASIWDPDPRLGPALSPANRGLFLLRLRQQRPAQRPGGVATGLDFHLLLDARYPLAGVAIGQQLG